MASVRDPADGNGQAGEGWAPTAASRGAASGRTRDVSGDARRWCASAQQDGRGAKGCKGSLHNLELPRLLLRPLDPLALGGEVVAPFRLAVADVLTDAADHLGCSGGPLHIFGNALTSCNHVGFPQIPSKFVEHFGVKLLKYTNLICFNKISKESRKIRNIF